MKPKIYPILILCAAIAALLWWRGCLKSNAESSVDSPFFIPVQVAISDEFRTPYVLIELENHKFSLLLDTGYSGGHVSLSTKNVPKIANKTLRRVRKTSSMFGKTYEENEYSIPKINIASIPFYNLTLHEEPLEFFNDTNIVPDGSELAPQTGKIGWELFRETNLLLDLKNSKIAFASSISMLENENYPIRRFTKAPLYLGRNCLEIDIVSSSSHKLLRCILDTGCTFNLFNTDLNIPIEEMMKKVGYITGDINCKLKGQDLGSIRFHPFPIKFSVHIDAILGMEFFMEHCVFLDFRNKTAYIMKYDQQSVDLSYGIKSHTSHSHDGAMACLQS